MTATLDMRLAPDQIAAVRKKAERLLESLDCYDYGIDEWIHLEDVHIMIQSMAKELGYTVRREMP